MQDNINATPLGQQWGVNTQTVNHYCQAPPPCVYPPSILNIVPYVTKSFRPSPPPYLCKWSKIGRCWQTTIATVYRKCVALFVKEAHVAKHCNQLQFVRDSSQHLTIYYSGCNLIFFFFLLCAEFVWHQCQEWSHENPTSYSGNWRALPDNWKAGGLWRWAELCRQWWKHATTYSADQKECTACHC